MALCKGDSCDKCLYEEWSNIIVVIALAVTCNSVYNTKSICHIHDADHLSKTDSIVGSLVFLYFYIS